MQQLRIKEDRKKMAKLLLQPEGKEPYYLHGTPLRNLAELVENLDKFSGEEYSWVASWIEYLGDKETADKIRANPQEFKNILIRRYNELKRYLK